VSGEEEREAALRQKVVLIMRVEFRQEFSQDFFGG
jgi:hypothetical protein